MSACYNLKNYTIFTGFIVNHPRRPLRINIGFLINQPAGFQREIPFELAELPIDENARLDVPKGLIRIARTQNGVRALIEFSAEINAECGRCLETFHLPLSTHFEEIFTFPNRPLSEDEQIIPEDGNIDFEPLVRDYLLLEVPINPVCTPGCRGLCVTCGENRNMVDCGHDQPGEGEALSALGLKLHQSLHQDEDRQKN
jgi:uncharacterized protein